MTSQIHDLTVICQLHVLHKSVSSTMTLWQKVLCAEPWQSAHQHEAGLEATCEALDQTVKGVRAWRTYQQKCSKKCFQCICWNLQQFTQQRRKFQHQPLGISLWVLVENCALKSMKILKSSGTRIYKDTTIRIAWFRVFGNDSPTKSCKRKGGPRSWVDKKAWPELSAADYLSKGIDMIEGWVLLNSWSELMLKHVPNAVAVVFSLIHKQEPALRPIGGGSFFAVETASSRLQSAPRKANRAKGWWVRPKLESCRKVES